MSNYQRNKGMTGRSAFKLMLQARDWAITSTADGVPGPDLLATDPDGVIWAVEVKNVKLIDPVKHLAQARAQAKKRRARWLLANHIYGTSEWLVQRQGHIPCIWSPNGGILSADGMPKGCEGEN